MLPERLRMTWISAPLGESKSRGGVQGVARLSRQENREPLGDSNALGKRRHGLTAPKTIRAPSSPARP